MIPKDPSGPPFPIATDSQLLDKLLGQGLWQVDHRDREHELYWLWIKRTTMKNEWRPFRERIIKPHFSWCWKWYRAPWPATSSTSWRLCHPDVVHSHFAGSSFPVQKCNLVGGFSHDSVSLTHPFPSLLLKFMFLCRTIGCPLPLPPKPYAAEKLL